VLDKWDRMKCAEEWLFEVNVLPPLVRELVYRSTGKPCATLSPGITGSPLSAQQMLHLCGPLKIVECECNTCDTLREVRGVCLANCFWSLSFSPRMWGQDVQLRE